MLAHSKQIIIIIIIIIAVVSTDETSAALVKTQLGSIHEVLGFESRAKS
jgi:hypothetical protein